MRIEKIAPVRDREAWPHGAHDFTTSLKKDNDVLSVLQTRKIECNAIVDELNS